MKYLIVLVLIVLFIIYKYFNTENFGRISGKWCIDCNKKSFGQCMDCFNCGFCLTESNKGYCTSGTVFGPKDKSDKCLRWIHNDDYINNLHRTNTCNT
jgi:hypothetical protein